MKNDYEVNTPADQPVIVMTRTFHAPREVVWEALTDPVHVTRWYGGHGFESPACEMDVRPGGYWRHTMRTPDGTLFSMEYVYLEVVRPERLVWQHRDHGKPRAAGQPPTVHMTVTLAEAGAGRTRWTLVSRFSTVSDRDHTAGMGFTRVIGQGCEKLDEVAQSIDARRQSGTGPAHALISGTFAPMLGSLARLLDKGAEHALAKGQEPSALVQARLFPDMFPLHRQVQLACLHARHGAARLTGREPQAYPDELGSIEELKALIVSTVAELSAVPASAFEGAEERDIVMPLPGDRVLEMKGFQFLRDWTLPHFYFHVVTAYDILRHQGVEIGKRDYLSYIGGAIRAA
jgi:uncharacterized protein YndB with AHSA1/START domain